MYVLPPAKLQVSLFSSSCLRAMVHLTQLAAVTQAAAELHFDTKAAARLCTIRRSKHACVIFEFVSTRPRYRRLVPNKLYCLDPHSAEPVMRFSA